MDHLEKKQETNTIKLKSLKSDLTGNSSHLKPSLALLRIESDRILRLKVELLHFKQSSLPAKIISKSSEALYIIITLNCYAFQTFFSKAFVETCL